MSYMRNKNLLGTLTNWEHVIDALPGKCGVSDIDGIIEKNGYFLVLESKNYGERLPLGQEILLRQLSLLKGFAVVIITMDRKTGDVYGIQRVTKGSLGETEMSDTEELSELVAQWFDHATKANRRKLSEA